MNKRMRELQAEIVAKNAEAQTALEAKELDKAKGLLDEVDALQDEYALNERAEKSGKVKAAAAEVEDPAKVDGFVVMAKMVNRQPLTQKESAAVSDMLSGEGATHGENLLIPEDVKVEINELRKSYVSAKPLVTVETTASLAGSVNYEAGAPAGLLQFEDGAVIGEETDLMFRRIPFTIKHFGKLIPISRILLGAEKAGLLSYINRWFVRSAVLTENQAIFGTLANGYNSGVAKAITGWKELKKSITVDLDPSCLLNGVIVTNQSGFAVLDEAEDETGRPILQPNPAHPTQKLFQGLPVHVFPNAQLADLDDGRHPVFYGDLKAGTTFVEHKALEFATSEHFGFGKNQNYMRVIEGFDVMSTDTSAYIYGAFGEGNPT